LVKLGYFLLVLIPTSALTYYTILKSKRLSDMLEAISDEKLPVAAKLRAVRNVWS
jgi:hypothetical protein